MEQNNSALGEGKLSKLMLKFSIPCVLSLLVSALYNIVDQIFIGNSELGALGNAATGVVFPIFIIAQAFAWCFGDGCAAFLNICQGKGAGQNAHKAIGTGISFTVIASLILMVVFYPLQRPLLLTFGASVDQTNALTGAFEPGSIDYAIQYFIIILAFFPVFMAMNMMNAVIRADGSPGWSMASMLSGAITNIVLDAAFIIGLKWGMAGAAWATVIGQCVSFVISTVYFIFKTKTFKMHVKSFIPDFKVFSNALKLGASSFITQMTIVIISLVCNIMLAKYGAMSEYGVNIPIAIIAIESKVFTVVVNIVVGIVLGCQPIIGYNVGANKTERVKKTYFNILLCTVVIGVVFTLIFELAPRAVVGIFGSPDPSQVNPELYWQFGEKTFRIFLSLVTFTCAIKMTSIFFQAVGKPVQAIVSSVLRDIVLFVPLVCILPIFGGIEYILIAAPIADIVAMAVAAILTVLYLRSLKTAKAKGKTAVESSDGAGGDALSQNDGAPALKPSRPGVIITIAREHGSGGKQIGKVLAQKLDIPFYYKEMTALAAQESGLDKEFISDLNQAAPTAIYDLYLSTTPAQQAIIAQDKIIKKIADNGSCVIVGRAADHILRDYPNVVKIFIHAPTEYKVKRISEIYGDDPEKAKNSVRRSDTARAKYYKNVSGNKWGDRQNYDLIVNSDIGIDNSVDLIYKFITAKTVETDETHE